MYLKRVKYKTIGIKNSIKNQNKSRNKGQNKNKTMLQNEHNNIEK